MRDFFVVLARNHREAQIHLEEMGWMQKRDVLIVIPSRSYVIRGCRLRDAIAVGCLDRLGDSPEWDQAIEEVMHALEVQGKYLGSVLYKQVMGVV